MRLRRFNGDQEGDFFMLWNAFILAQREIRRNALRSFLTTLGVVIGVAAVIVMVTVGNGVTAKVTADIAKLGNNLLIVRPGQMRGPGGGATDSRAFSIADADAIAREITSLSAVAPSASRTMTAIAGNANWNTTVHGSDNAYLDTRAWQLAQGRLFNEAELRAGKAVCIIGETVRQELFGAQNAVGNQIRLQNLACEVVGLLAAKGQSGMGQDQDDLVLMPLRTFQRRISGNQDIRMIQVSVRDGIATEKAVRDIENLLRERRRIGAGQADDFSVHDMKEIAATMTETTKMLTALLSAVAAVSLLVGGIGIMNIMLVSVTERTREIGTRLAIGALEREVLLQFLVEAVVLSAFGGILGIILALSAALLFTEMLGVPFILDAGIIAVAFLFSAAVGVVFGYFPARRAARLDPIEALRHE
jgi:putative ABC transport system permease protein